jgi:hypothetical protein
MLRTCVRVPFRTRGRAKLLMLEFWRHLALVRIATFRWRLTWHSPGMRKAASRCFYWAAAARWLSSGSPAYTRLPSFSVRWVFSARSAAALAP